MKKIIGLLCTLLCLGCGFLYVLNLISNMNFQTGLLYRGSVGLRYLLLALPIVLIGLCSLCVDGASAHPIPLFSGLLGFCGMLLSGIIGLVLCYAGGGSSAVLVSSALLCLGAVWFMDYLLRKEKAGIFWALAGIFSWAVMIAQLFLVKVSSIHHLLNTVELVCCIGCLWGLLGLTQAGYTPGRPGGARKLFVYGMLCFFFGFCILLPQEVLMFSERISPVFLPGKCVASGTLGLAGLCAALCAAKRNEKLPQQTKSLTDDLYIANMFADGANVPGMKNTPTATADPQTPAAVTDGTEAAAPGETLPHPADTPAAQPTKSPVGQPTETGNAPDGTAQKESDFSASAPKSNNGKWVFKV